MQKATKKEVADALDQQRCDSKKTDDDKVVQEKKMQFKIEVYKEKIKALDNGIKTSQKLLDAFQAYGPVTNLDADDLDTIQQCELSIAESYRQRLACLAMMDAHSPVVINDEMLNAASTHANEKECSPPPATATSGPYPRIPVTSKRYLDAPDVKSVPPTFLKPSNEAWAALSLKTSEEENFGVVFELTLDAQAAPSVDFQVLLDGLPIGVTLPGQTGIPKPVSLEIGIHKITCWFKDMQPAGVFFTNAIAIVNQKMPKVRYLAPFTVSLLTERTGDRLSYNDDVNPKNDWPRYICTPKEADIFTTGNAQRKFQKLEGEMSALLQNIQGNKSFPTCRFWPNEACVLGTK